MGLDKYFGTMALAVAAVESLEWEDQMKPLAYCAVGIGEDWVAGIAANMSIWLSY